jgi:2',3'-cyclic-nucleotide 2'-phosphodiesterase/3'-nucleotidase
MKYRSVRFYLVVILFSASILSCREQKSIKISILETTDLHGHILPYDFVEKKSLDASLAHAVSYFKKVKLVKDAVFLLDGGDNLQGQPPVYYSNYIDTVSPHFMSEVFNWLGYDAVTAGNHDIEAGHSVYDRLIREYGFPLLAANAVKKESGKPYFQPYVILEKKKIKVAVLGLITPAIPTWLPEELYSGMEFRDMLETARLWMPEILKQKPDLVVGLFHSGWNSESSAYSRLDENGSAAVAYNVPGFDIIFNGHDHQIANEKFVNIAGDTLLILNAGSWAESIACADITLVREKNKRKKPKIISGKIIQTSAFEPDTGFINKFKKFEEVLNEYVGKVIGTSSSVISTRDSYFGSSAFVDMIHSVQMEITGAEISFAAPLSFDVKIDKGPVTVGDMFKLYRFENMLYTMRLTGEEIRKYLEYSYSEWLNTMKGPGDFLLKYRLGKDGKPLITNRRAWLRNQSYNFDSAVGIDYFVDVSKPEGDRVIIRSFTNGRPFEKSGSYKVALNSYRGNGGGGHITEGAGIPPLQLFSRLISCTDRDLRYYILKSIEAKRTISPAPYNNWRIVPEKWVENAIPREKLLLFGTTK